jgi:hypothetical protein
MKRNEHTCNDDEHGVPLLGNDNEKGESDEEEVKTLYKVYMTNLNELERKIINICSNNTSSNNVCSSIVLFNVSDNELQNVHDDLVMLFKCNAVVKGRNDNKKVELMLRCVENKIKQFKYNYHKCNIHNKKIEEWLCKMENTFQQGKNKYYQKTQGHSLSALTNSFYSSIGDKTNIAFVFCMITIIILIIYFFLF